MPPLNAYSKCSTSGLIKLDLQLIRQIQRIAPGTLVSFNDLNVSLGAGCHPYLQGVARRAFEQAIAQRGLKITVNSAYRTIAQQAILYKHFSSKRCGIVAAAQAGKSSHNSGLSLDIEDPRGWRPYLERYGWRWLGEGDPPHFDYTGAGAKDMRWISTKAFQQLWNFNNRHKRIAEDGILGLQTYQALMMTSDEGFKSVPGAGADIAYLPDIPKPSKHFIRPLSFGMSGSDVLTLQMALADEGIQIEEDGFYGQKTLEAVRHYQQSAGLTIDGIAGSATFDSLELH